ncbi:MAG: MMPL family transporter [Bacteroidetes bacterium]|nr:MMPL family transporter [Bacteroidota bacterium]HET6243058.1 MMPL family transporter [Bacteroidia bacterium]
MYKLYSRIFLVITFVITVVSAIIATGLKFDYDFESFFPVNDPDLDYYQEFRRNFENDNDYILIGISNKASIFDQYFLNKIDALTDSLKNIPYILSVVSPTTIKNPIVGPLGIIEVPYIHLNKPELYHQDSLNIYQTKELPGNIFANNARSVALYVTTVNNPSKAKSDSIADNIFKILKNFNFHTTHVAGKVIGQKVYLQTMSDEMKIFVVSSIILVILFLFLSYRSVWGVVVPLIIVVVSLIWLFAFMKITGKSIDLMVTLIPTILYIVGMSDIIHLLSKYLEELRLGKEKIAALKTSLKEVGLATFLTTITTAAGFLTLLTAGIKPVREFGLYLAVGIFIAFILTFTILPAILINLNTPKITEKANHNKVWNKYLGKIVIFVFKRHKTILIITGFVLIASFIGISKIKINNYLLEDLSEKVQLKQSFNFFEKEYSGARAFEMVVNIEGSTESVLNYKILQEINKIEEYLYSVYGTGHIISPLFLVKSANRAFNGGGNNAFVLPEKEGFDQLVEKLSNFKKRKEFRTLISEDQKSARLTAKIPDWGSHLINEKNAQLENFFISKIDTTLINYKLTGGAHLIDKNNENLSKSMLQGLLIAFLIIAFIVGIMFKSIKMIIIALFPNFLPLVMIGGIMGFTGIDLKVSTSIIFTIAFGIAVDDSIHFLSKLRQELRKGKTLPYAIKRTMLSTGKAIVITSMILCGGFLTLILSDFSSTFYIGLLISLTLLFAILADLLLLPALLLMIIPKKLKEN